MLEIHTNKFGKPRRIDLHNLPVGNAMMAHQLGGPDLYRVMQKLGVGGITSSMGWQDLALRYGVFLEEQKEARTST
jgi:hypothetical protein